MLSFYKKAQIQLYCKISSVLGYKGDNCCQTVQTAQRQIFNYFTSHRWAKILYAESATLLWTAISKSNSALSDSDLILNILFKAVVTALGNLSIKVHTRVVKLSEKKMVFSFADPRRIYSKAKIDDNDNFNQYRTSNRYWATGPSSIHGLPDKRQLLFLPPRLNF